MAKKQQMDIHGELETIPETESVDAVVGVEQEKRKKRSRLEIATERLEDAKVAHEMAGLELRKAELEYDAAVKRSK